MYIDVPIPVMHSIMMQMKSFRLAKAASTKTMISK